MEKKRPDQLLRIRRKRVRGMVALGRLASRVPLDQVLGALHKKHAEQATQEQFSRGLNRCNGRWSLFQFTDTAEG